jgi:hypothetical protein
MPASVASFDIESATLPSGSMARFENQRLTQRKPAEMDKANNSVDGRNNSQAELQHLVSLCNDALARGREGGLASAQAYREAGAALRALKGLSPHGQFGPIATKRCGCSKQWRARLMSLDREWADVEAAGRWAEGCGHRLDAKAYSVDGALSLLREWRRVQSGDARTARRSPGVKPRMQAALQNKLSAARAYTLVLEEKLAAFQSETRQEDLDEATRLKVQQVAALWHRGGTDGERFAATHQLLGIACNRGWRLSALLQACSIEGPADWTF